MIRVLRRKIRDVRYYSARRRHTIWSRLAAWSMVTALGGAVVAILVSEQVVRRATVIRTLRGGLVHLDSGRLEALKGDANGDVRWPDGNPYADFLVADRELRRGWPFATRIDPLPTTLDINVFAESGQRTGVTLAEDDPMRRALATLDATVVAAPLHTWLADPGRTAESARRSWHAVAAVLVIWILGLYVIQLALIGVTRLAWRYRSVLRLTHSAHRLDEGCCHRCGYDMRGLEFNDRCPECGQLVK